MGMYTNETALIDAIIPSIMQVLVVMVRREQPVSAVSHR